MSTVSGFRRRISYFLVWSRLEARRHVSGYQNIQHPVLDAWQSRRHDERHAGAEAGVSRALTQSSQEYHPGGVRLGGLEDGNTRSYLLILSPEG